MALKDILTNAKYADDMVLSLPDGSTATVGEMRGMEADERNALVQRQNLLSQAEMELASRFQRAVQSGWLDAQGNVVQPRAQSDTEIRRQAVEVAAQSGIALDENDPLLGPVVREVRKMQTEQKSQLDAFKTEMKGTIATLAGVAKQSVGAYLDDFYGMQFERLKGTLPSKSKVSLEEAMKYAEENNFKDKAGRLDLSSAVDRMTWAEKKQEELDRLTKEANERADKASAMAQLNRPRAGSIRNETVKDGFKPTNEKGRTKSLDEALNEASADTELFESAARVASGVYVQ
jgi:hypothetical protein